MKSGRRLAFYGGSEPSDYIETFYRGIYEKEGKLMSDFELLSIVLMMISIILQALKGTKK